MPGDFLHQVIAAAVAAAIDSPVAVARLETKLRRQWGGERVYIKKATADAKAAALAVAITNGRSPADAIRDLGIPTRTGYDLLSRKWSP